MESLQQYSLPIVALLVIAISTLVLSLLKVLVFTPAHLSRKLRQQGIHVLPYVPLSGNAYETRRMQDLARISAPLPLTHDIVARILPFYTKIFSRISERTFVYWWGTQPRLVVTNPEYVKQIMSADVKSYSKSDFAHKSLHRLFGSGLLLAEGEDWHNQRTLLRPAFFPEKLKAMVADMHLSAVVMAKDWAEIIGSGSGEEVEVARPLKNTTADILARTCFGSDYKSGKEVFGKQELLLEVVFVNGLANSLIPGYKFLPLPSNFTAWRIERSIDKQLSRVVKSRIEAFHKGVASASDHMDLLGLILAGEEGDEKLKKSKLKALNAQQIMAECRTFFFAGHETTANLLAWTMMLLALYPEYQERVRAEVLEICGSKEAPTPHADQLNKLKLLAMVLHESLRLYPPVPELSVRMGIVNHSFKVGNLELPQGMSFAIPTLAIHRDKELWGDDADQFRPERFHDGVSKACKHPFGFLPFGIGPRMCIGQGFALLESKAIMAVILQRFRFHMSPNYKHSPETMITMRPAHGMQLILEHA